MHRLLLIDELLVQIIQDIRDNGIRTLAAVARTCQLFHRPAIEALWECLMNIAPIVRLLPDDAWSTRLVNGQIIYYDLRRTLVASDYVSITKYAPLVKYLGVVDPGVGRDYSHYYNHYVYPEVRQTITSCCPHAILFPALHTLSYREEHIVVSESHSEMTWIWPDMLVFIGPTLREVIIYSETFPDQFDRSRRDNTWEILMAVLTKIEKECPSLERLKLPPSLPRNSLPHISSQLSSLVYKLPNLKVLHCGNASLTKASLLHIAYSDALCELHDGLSTTGTYPSLSSLPTRSLFPALRILEIHESDLQSYIDFAQFTKLPRVETFSIKVSTLPSQHILSSLFSAIARQFSHSRLAHLTVSSPCFKRSDVITSNAILRSEHLRPLLAFCELETVFIDANWMVDYGDSILQAMAAAWPKLTSLALAADDMNGPPWVRPHSSASLESLLAFSLHCPRLTYLRILLHADGSRLPEWPSVIQRGRQPPANKLNTLEISESTITKPSKVAAFLLENFPNLDTIYATGKGKNPALWEEVSEFLHCVAWYRKARESCSISWNE